MIDRHVTLESELIRLEPLSEENFPCIRAVANDPALWEFTFQRWLDNEASAQEWYRAATASDHVTFAIIDRRSDRVIGSTRYLDISQAYRKLEIGWTFVARSHWRTHVNTECKYLLLRHAFESWNAVRVQLKADGRNLRSHEAIRRIGASYEGTLRNFRISPDDGSLRDVAYFSVIESEWPAVKARLETLRATYCVDAACYRGPKPR